MRTTMLQKCDEILKAFLEKKVFPKILRYRSTRLESLRSRLFSVDLSTMAKVWTYSSSPFSLSTTLLMVVRSLSGDIAIPGVSTTVIWVQVE